MTSGKSIPAAPAETDNAPLTSYNPSIPNAARVYDVLLGGKDNFAADRVMADRLTRLIPDLPVQVRANRAFLGRVVTDLARAGVRQFLDLGSGLPTRDNVHQIVHRVQPDARIVYVDADPVVAAHSRALLAKHPSVRFIEADVRDPAELLGRAELDLLDPSEPVAVTAIALLHFMPGDQPQQIVTALRKWMTPGSYLVISHATPGAMSPEAVEQALAQYRRANLQMHLRSPEEIAELFEGFQLSDDGIVPVGLWRPEPEEVPFPERDRTPDGGHFIGGFGWLAASP